MRLTRAERENYDRKVAEAALDPDNLVMGAALNIKVAVEAVARPFPDVWGGFCTPRGKPKWHLWRHVESIAGGTYGWWPVCQAHISQSSPWGETHSTPPKGEPVCQECRRRRGKAAKWEQSPQAADWLFGGGS